MQSNLWLGSQGVRGHKIDQLRLHRLCTLHVCAICICETLSPLARYFLFRDARLLRPRNFSPGCVCFNVNSPAWIIAIAVKRATFAFIQIGAGCECVCAATRLFINLWMQTSRRTISGGADLFLSCSNIDFIESSQPQNRDDRPRTSTWEAARETDLHTNCLEKIICPKWAFYVLF